MHFGVGFLTLIYQLQKKYCDLIKPFGLKRKLHFKKKKEKRINRVTFFKSRLKVTSTHYEVIKKSQFKINEIIKVNEQQCMLLYDLYHKTRPI